MRISAPWIVSAAVAAEGLPIVAALLRPSLVRGPRVYILLWCLVTVASNLWGRWLGLRGINNHFISYIVTPIQGSLILWALSLWQLQATARLTMRIMIPPFLVAWAVLTLTVEDLANFSAVAEPVYCLLALGACLFTLIARAQEAREPLPRHDWFWICSGFAVTLGMTAFLTPLAAALVHDHVEIVLRAYVVRAYVTVFAFFVITRGMLCPLPTPSGRSS